MVTANASAPPPPGPARPAGRPVPAPANLVSDDPWDSADGATWDSTFGVFGLVQAEVWFAALVKGVGKVRFDPLQHSPDQRVTAVTIAVVPVVATQQPAQRDMIAESSEWARVVNPSIKALGTTLRGLHDRYVEARLVPTGRTYTNASGEVKSATTFRFVRLFGSEDECRAAAEQGRRWGAGSEGRVVTPPDGDGAVPGDSGAFVRPGAAAPGGIPREVAARFLAGLWSASGRDLGRFEELLQKNAVTAQHFDLNSPEVVAVVSQNPPA